MILGKREILSYVKRGIIRIEPFREENVGPASVDLTLGRVFRVFEGGERIVLDENIDPSSMGELVEGEVVLKPGSYVLGITEERIGLPDNIMGILSGRSRFARLGVFVHVSSNIVHPGSYNKQVLEIFNAGPYEVVLRPGVRICQITFAEVRGGVPRPDRYSYQTLP